jgi:hypothetical protein
MFQEAELSFSSYKPLSLEKGMLFYQILHEGTSKQTIDVYKLGRVPVDQELYISKHGFPINLQVLDERYAIIAESEKLAWFDKGDDSDVLSDLEVEQINTILNKHGGYLLVDLELYEGKVTIRYIDEEEENEDDDDDEAICLVCNGSGEGMYDGSTCKMCYGSGVIKDERDEGDVPEYDEN